MSHKHRFKGLELYEGMGKIKEYIETLRQHKEHEVLKKLQKSLENSLAGLQTDYEALKQGQNILNKLSDLLYGPKDDKGLRNTQEHKEQTNSKKVQQEVEQLLEKSHEEYKTHSSQMRGYLRHFQSTHQNWKPNLYTCYDHTDLVNDNNRQELSHSQIKREYRRITGQKSTAKYLKIHGEQAAFILDFAQGQNTKQEIETILRKTDYQQLKQEKKRQKEKSKLRGKTTPTVRNLDKTYQFFIDYTPNGN